MNRIPRRGRNAETLLLGYRTFKNFGHKPQPIPGITMLWHGFLTFTLIGCGLNWKRIGKWTGFYSDENDDDVDNRYIGAENKE